MKQLWADPKFAAAARSRIELLNNDPHFAAMAAAAARLNMKRQRADPHFEKKRIEAIQANMNQRLRRLALSAIQADD